jgi:hypothetical protein
MWAKELPWFSVRLFAVVCAGVGLAVCSFCRAADAPTATKTFATPQEVVTAYRHAHEKGDWRTCFVCLTPDARGWTMQEFCFVISMGNSPELVKAIGKHTKAKFDEKYFDPIYQSASKQVNGHDEVDHALLYEAFAKRIPDLPSLVADACEQWPLFADFGEVTNIKVEGDKAAGSLTPFPQNAPPLGPIPANELLRFIHFRKIGGTWLIVDPPLHQ